VALLLPILLRHLQRFTLRTCHSFETMLPHAAPTCTLNNLMQTGAAEGLAFLSGVAVAGQRMGWRQVTAGRKGSRALQKKEWGRRLGPAREMGSLIREGGQPA
jgi:hypothetical protein